MTQQVAEVETVQHLTFTNSSPTWHSCAEGKKRSREMFRGAQCGQGREYRWLRPNLTHLSSATPQNITTGITFSFSLSTKNYDFRRPTA